MKNRANSSEAKQSTPLALSAAELAGKLGVSLRHVRRMDSAQLLPKPIRLGRSVRWPVHELNAWMQAGAPNRRQWDQVCQRTGRRDGR